MANNKEIGDKKLEAVAGGTDNEEGFKIEVDYVIWGPKNPGAKERYEMTYWVEQDETIEHIETRTWQHCFANSAVCETFYNGALVAKTTTIRELGIKPYEKLTMTVEASGGGW